MVTFAEKIINYNRKAIDIHKKNVIVTIATVHNRNRVSRRVHPPNPNLGTALSPRSIDRWQEIAKTVNIMRYRGIFSRSKEDSTPVPSDSLLCTHVVDEKSMNAVRATGTTSKRPKWARRRQSSRTAARKVKNTGSRFVGGSRVGLGAPSLFDPIDCPLHLHQTSIINK